MAELNKIILKSADTEIFTSQNYKVYPELIDSPLWASLDNQPSIIDTENIKKLDTNKVVGIHYNGDTKSISELNNQADFDTVNALRNANITYTAVLSVEGAEDTTLEYIPEHPHILEQIENIERMETEYSSKLKMLSYLVSNLYDTPYATNMHMIGRDTKISLEDTNDRLDTSITISGYIKVENANANIILNYILRGIPLPMRKTLTSTNSNGTKNYIFTYPQYILKNIDLIQAIQYIEVLVPDLAKFYYGHTYSFLLDTDDALKGFEANLANLHIVNKVARNLNSEVETPIPTV